MNPLLECHHISKKYTRTVLDDFSFSFAPGMIYALSGPSGSGKSTLLNVIAGLETLDDGHIVFDGGPRATGFGSQHRHLLAHDIAYLFQNYALIDHQSVKANLRLMNASKKTILAALEAVGLGDVLNSKVYTLSGGEQQRVALARTMLRPFRLLLADEPTGNLDAVNADKVFEIFETMRDEGKTIIIATHSEAIMERCDVVVSLQ